MVVLNSEKSSLSDPQGHYPTTTAAIPSKVVHTQRKDGAILKGLLRLSLRQYLPTSILSFSSHTGVIPKLSFRSMKDLQWYVGCWKRRQERSNDVVPTAPEQEQHCFINQIQMSSSPSCPLCHDWSELFGNSERNVIPQGFFRALWWGWTDQRKGKMRFISCHWFHTGGSGFLQVLWCPKTVQKHAQ